MPTFALPRFLETRAEHVAHARALEQVVRHDHIDTRTRRLEFTAADARTLRGIPAIGRGVAGAIDGTTPGPI